MLAPLHLNTIAGTLLQLHSVCKHLVQSSERRWWSKTLWSGWWGYQKHVLSNSIPSVVEGMLFDEMQSGYVFICHNAIWSHLVWSRKRCRWGDAGNTTLQRLLQWAATEYSAIWNDPTGLDSYRNSWLLSTSAMSMTVTGLYVDPVHCRIVDTPSLRGTKGSRNFHL